MPFSQLQIQLPAQGTLAASPRPTHRRHSHELMPILQPCFWKTVWSLATYVIHRADHSSDTMRRHAKQAHKAEPKRLCDVRTKRTCRKCWVANSRCEGQRPCRRCLREGLRCSFSDDRPSLPRSNIDSTSLILRYTQHYFEHFHPQWPFLHRGTYSVRDEPSLLLYSVVTIGLWKEGSTASRATALALQEKIGNSIYQQKVGTKYFLP